jgi:flagellar biogenesis protein FliO
MDIVRQSLAITIVFALLWAALWLLKRKGSLSPGRTKGGPHPIELRGKLGLSAQHSLHLVRVGGRELLLGVHPSGFTVICDQISCPPAHPDSPLS